MYIVTRHSINPMDCGVPLLSFFIRLSSGFWEELGITEKRPGDLSKSQGIEIDIQCYLFNI